MTRASLWPRPSWQVLAAACLASGPALAPAFVPALALAQAPTRLTPVPVAADGQSPARQPAPAQPPVPHLPVPQSAVVPAPQSPPRSVVVRAGQQDGWGRVTFRTGDGTAPAVHPIDGGVELRFPGTVMLDTSGLRAVTELQGVEQRADGGDTIVTLHMACACTAGTGRANGLFYLDLHPVAAPAPTDAPQHDDAARPRSAPATLTAAQIRSQIQAKIQAKIPAQKIAAQKITAQTGKGARPTPAANGTAASGPVDEMATLRDSLAAKLAILNGTAPPPGAAAGAAPGAAAAASPPPPPRPVCKPEFNLAAWKGQGNYTDRLAALRARAARGTESAADMAPLVEFYLANGLAPEALDTIAAVNDQDPLPEATTRLARDGDIARLLLGQPPLDGSPLLADHVECEREDLALWRALSAAVAGDADALKRDAPRARAVLRDVPDPLRTLLARRIADGTGEDLETLRAMAAAMRNADISTPEDEAARLLLDARVAHAEKNPADETLFLERAAALDGALPALDARARLAAIDATRPGPAQERAEEQLTDIARTYRFEKLGQDAGDELAELKLTRGDYRGALQLADEGAIASRGGESRGARMTARILRTLLVDPATPATPPPGDRLAMFWQYEGYATPGEKGDDIRLGAARLMLEQSMPDAALDVMRQISTTVAVTPAAATLRAEAEARAEGGDPQAALALLHDVPPSDATRRVASTALARLGRPAEAAQQLDGLSGLTDQEHRAGLLFDAKSWADAVGAYTALLHDPATPPAARTEAADRSALALAMEGGSPPRDLPAPPAAAVAGRVLETLAIPPASTDRPVDAVRDAIERSKHIETLLNP